MVRVACHKSLRITAGWQGKYKDNLRTKEHRFPVLAHQRLRCIQPAVANILYIKLFFSCFMGLHYFSINLFIFCYGLYEHSIIASRIAFSSRGAANPDLFIIGLMMFWTSFVWAIVHLFNTHTPYIQSFNAVWSQVRGGQYEWGSGSVLKGEVTFSSGTKTAYVYKSRLCSVPLYLSC